MNQSSLNVKHTMPLRRTSTFTSKFSISQIYTMHRLEGALCSFVSASYKWQVDTWQNTVFNPCIRSYAQTTTHDQLWQGVRKACPMEPANQYWVRLKRYMVQFALFVKSIRTIDNSAGHLLLLHWTLLRVLFIECVLQLLYNKCKFWCLSKYKNHKS